MQFIKNFFKHDSVVGLSGLMNKDETPNIKFPQNYKKTYVINTQNNYLLI